MAKTNTGSLPKGRSFFRLSGRIAIATALLVSAAAFAAGSNAASLSFISSIGEMLGLPTAQFSTGLTTKPVEPSSSATEPTLLTNGGSFTSLGQTLTENFNTLASSGQDIPWANDTLGTGTIPGAYASATSYRTSGGTTNLAGMYSFGSGTDRALGSLGSIGTGVTHYYGFKLVNNTGQNIGSLQISYFGEQWRASDAAAQKIDFQYQVANSGVVTDANLPTTGWVDYNPLDFVGPIANSTDVGIDGNLPANRTLKSAIIGFSVPVQPLQEIWIRWVDIDDPGNDHGLGIDDLSITALAQSYEHIETPGVANWTAPAGVTSITVEIWGGGGGGGGDLNGEDGAGGGGGGGAYARLDSYTVVPGNNYPYTIGVAGAGGGTNGNGGNGGFSQFVDGSTLNAAGGAGGQAASGSTHGAGGAAGAAGTTGNVKFSGGSGNTSNSADTGGGGGGSGGTASSGNPATSILGAAAVADGGPGGNGGSGANGNAPATAPGGGGGGGGSAASGRTGGPGSPGQIRISYIFPPETAPTVTAPTVSGIGATGATLGANVTSDGGAAITARGTCWGTVPGPTGNCSIVTGTTGVFTGPSAGTMPVGTLIYFRGYATNSVGTSYSDDGTFSTGVVQTASVTNSPKDYTGGPLFAEVECSGGGAAFNILTGGQATQTDANEAGYAVLADCPATPGYAAGTAISADVFKILKIDQAALSVTGPGSATFGTPATISIEGGSGNGTLSFSHGISTGCTVNSSTGEITVNNASGTCAVSVTKAGDTNYHAATSLEFPVTLNKAGSTTVIDCSPGEFAYTGLPVEPCGSATVTRVGASDTAAPINYANNRAIGDNTATANASYAGDDNHNGSTAPQVTFSIVVPSLTFNSTANLPAGTYQDITVESGGVVTVTGDIVVVGCVTVKDGGTLLMGGFTITGPGCFSVEAGGTIGIGSANGISSDGSSGNVRVAGAISYGTGGRYIYNGTGDQTVGSGLPSTVADLEIDNSGTPGTVRGNSGQVVTDTLSITNGVYVSSSDYHNVVIASAGTLSLEADITVSGNWTNNGGSLVHNNFGVTFDGLTGQTIAGNTTFYDFRKSNGAGQTMFFTAGSTTMVENNLTLSGIAGSRLSLRSTLQDSEWIIDPNSTSAGYVDVRDSNNTGTPITVSNSINQGNNTGWTFRLAITPDSGQSKVFGAPDPVLTYAQDITDLNVPVTGALSYSGTGIGLHPITIGNLAAAGYTITLNPQNFEITLAVDTPSVTNSGQTYTGSAINIEVTCISGGTATNISPESQTNVGVYSVTASCPGNANYSATVNVSAGNFEIIKAPDTPSVSNSGQTYTGNPIDITVSCLSGGTATAISPVSQTNVGVYTVTASCPGNANYSATANVSAGNFAITPAATTTTVTCPLSAVYTGAAIQPCTYSVSGPGLTIGPLAVASGGYSNNVNVGIATATHNYAGGGNYAASSGVKNFNITAAAPTCTVTGYNVSYDGNPHTTANGTCTGVLAENVAGTFNMSSTTHSVPGTYNDPWTFTPSSANYSIVNGSVTNVISFCSSVSIQTGITSRGGGANVEIPINTTSVTNGNLAAVQFTFNYSSSVLDPTPANISVAAGNVLSPSSVITFDANTPGTITVSISNTLSEVFADAGSIVKINMRVIGAIGSTSPLTLTGLKWFTAGPPLAEVLGCAPSVPGSLTVISGTVSGTVRYMMDINYPVPGPHATPTPGPTSVSRVVKDVTISASGPSPLPTPAQAMTDSAGLYSMNGFGNGVYSIAPFKTPHGCGLSTSGINANDPALISRRVVNLITFSADQEKAAKVSGLDFVSALDATLVARFLVCVPNPGSQVGVWNFDPSGSSLVDNVNGGTYNFKALLMGDVSGDWNPTEPQVPGLSEQLIPMTAARVSVSDMQAERNSSVTVPLRLDNLYGAGVDSYQFEIQYDPAVIQPSEIAAQLEGTVSEGMNLMYNVPSPGSLLVVVYGVLPAVGDGVFANLKFVTIGAVGSSSPLTINGFRFNDGKTEVVTSNGALSVNVPSNPVIKGRVLGPNGQAIRNAQVFLTAANGESFAVNSSSLGYFEFGGLSLGETYTISVRSRRFRFTSQTVSITDRLALVDMIGLE